jgi:type III secretory pathway component EscS
METLLATMIILAAISIAATFTAGAVVGILQTISELS